MRYFKQKIVTLLITSLIICSCPEYLFSTIPGNSLVYGNEAKTESSQETIEDGDISDTEKEGNQESDKDFSQNEAVMNDSEYETEADAEPEDKGAEEEPVETGQDSEMEDDASDETGSDENALSDTNGDEIEDQKVDENTDEEKDQETIPSDKNDEVVGAEQATSENIEDNKDDNIVADPETEEVSTPSVNAGSYSETIELTAGAREHRMYFYNSPNIVFENPFEENVRVTILSRQSSGNGYLYSVGYTGLVPGTNTPVRPYDPDTGEYLDLIIVHISAYEITDTACVGSTYSNRLTGAKEALPMVTVEEGPCTPDIDIMWNGSSTGLGGTTHYYAISTVFHQVGTYTISFIDTEKWKMVGTLTVVVGNHFWNDGTIRKEATCLEEGLLVKTCSLCGNTLEESIPVSDHVWDTKFTVDQDATCISEGKKSIHCKVCDGINANTMVSIPKAEHQWNNSVTVDIWPTCTQDGLAFTYCNVCGTKKEGSEEILPSTDHHFGEWHELFGPTCTDYGIKQRNCTSCGYLEEEAIPETGHIWDDYYQIHDATCTTDGYEGIYCSICGALNEETFHIIEHTGHWYGDSFIRKEPSCIEEGIIDRVCMICGETVTETIPIEPHSWNEYYTIDKESTCTEEGSESVHCFVCDVIDGGTIQAIPKKDHNYGDWTTIKEAKCLEEGCKEKACAVCGDKVTETISATGHSWNEDYTVDKEATYTEEGSESIHCSACGEIKEGTSKPISKLRMPMSMLSVSGIVDKTYTGNALTQSPVVKNGSTTLKAGTDYTVSYKNNTNAGTATVIITGKGNYTGTKNATFKINKAAQNIAIKVSAASIAVGKTATVSVTGAVGAKSFKSSLATVAAINAAGTITAKKAGSTTITATAAATANYNAASKTVSIKVVPAATSSITAANQATGIKLTWKSVAGATGYKVYRGAALIKTIKGGSTSTCTDAKANANGTKYTFKIVPTAPTGDGLAKTLTTYRVARPTVSSAANTAARKMTVKWKKNAKANGYQIQYSTNKKFASGNKTVNITKAATVSRVIAGLAKGKTYYVRIRTYKTAGKAKYWSVWSPTKSVKISK